MLVALNDVTVMERVAVPGLESGFQEISFAGGTFTVQRAWLVFAKWLWGRLGGW